MDEAALMNKEIKDFIKKIDDDKFTGKDLYHFNTAITNFQEHLVLEDKIQKKKKRFIKIF